MLSAAAGVDPYVGEPYDVWLRLRAAYGRRVTIVDLYELVAARRGRCQRLGPQRRGRVRAGVARSGHELCSRERDRRYLRPGAGSPRTVQFHVCDAGSQWERDHLLFRDYLRSNPAARAAYDRGKHETAATWRDDRIAYGEAKTGIILDLLEQAEEWARRTAWHVGSG